MQAPCSKADLVVTSMDLVAAVAPFVARKQLAVVSTMPSGTEPDDDVHDVTSSSALDVASTSSR